MPPPWPYVAMGLDRPGESHLNTSFFGAAGWWWPATHVNTWRVRSSITAWRTTRPSRYVHAAPRTTKDGDRGFGHGAKETKRRPTGNNGSLPAPQHLMVLVSICFNLYFHPEKNDQNGGFIWICMILCTLSLQQSISTPQFYGWVRPLLRTSPGGRQVVGGGIPCSHDPGGGVAEWDGPARSVSGGVLKWG